MVGRMFVAELLHLSDSIGHHNHSLQAQLLALMEYQNLEVLLALRSYWETATPQEYHIYVSMKNYDTNSLTRKAECTFSHYTLLEH